MPKVELWLPFDVVGKVLGGIARGVGDGIHVIADAVSPAPQPEVLPQGVEVLPDEDQGMGDQVTEIQPTPQLDSPMSQAVLGRRTYVVQPGDSLIEIAVKEYGDPKRWMDILGINGIQNSRNIQIGQVLVLPA